MESGDPYSPSIVYDLLSGKNEWKNIQDIVKITFKAICDTVKVQGQAIRHMEQSLANKASNSDLTSGLMLKANVSDVSRTIADIQNILDEKLSAEELSRHLDDRVSK